MERTPKRKRTSGPSGQNQPVRVNVKLNAGATREQTLDRTQGVLSAAPLFPDEEDEELSTIYVVDIEFKDAQAVVERFEKDPQVEYVERPPVRKLGRSPSR